MCVCVNARSKLEYPHLQFVMGWFVLEQSLLTAYLDFRWLEHLCASTFAVLTSDSKSDSLDPNTNLTMFGSRWTHFPIQRQSSEIRKNIFWLKFEIMHSGTHKLIHPERGGGELVLFVYFICYLWLKMFLSFMIAVEWFALIFWHAIIECFR